MDVNVLQSRSIQQRAGRNSEFALLAAACSDDTVSRGLTASPAHKSWLCGMFDDRTVQTQRAKQYASTSQHPDCSEVLLRVLDSTKSKLYTLHAQPLIEDGAVPSHHLQPSLVRGTGTFVDISAGPQTPCSLSQWPTALLGACGMPASFAPHAGLQNTVDVLQQISGQQHREIRFVEMFWSNVAPGKLLLATATVSLQTYPVITAQPTQIHAHFADAILGCPDQPLHVTLAANRAVWNWHLLDCTSVPDFALKSSHPAPHLNQPVISMRSDLQLASEAAAGAAAAAAAVAAKARTGNAPTAAGCVLTSAHVKWHPDGSLIAMAVSGSGSSGSAGVAVVSAALEVVWHSPWAAAASYSTGKIPALVSLSWLARSLLAAVDSHGKLVIYDQHGAALILTHNQNQIPRSPRLWLGIASLMPLNPGNDAATKQRNLHAAQESGTTQPQDNSMARPQWLWNPASQPMASARQPTYTAVAVCMPSTMSDTAAPCVLSVCNGSSIVLLSCLARPLHGPVSTADRKACASGTANIPWTVSRTPLIHPATAKPHHHSTGSAAVAAAAHVRGKPQASSPLLQNLASAKPQLHAPPNAALRNAGISTVCSNVDGVGKSDIVCHDVQAAEWLRMGDVWAKQGASSNCLEAYLNAGVYGFLPSLLVLIHQQDIQTAVALFRAFASFTSRISSSTASPLRVTRLGSQNSSTGQQETFPSSPNSQPSWGDVARGVLLAQRTPSPCSSPHRLASPHPLGSIPVSRSVPQLAAGIHASSGLSLINSRPPSPSRRLNRASNLGPSGLSGSFSAIVGGSQSLPASPQPSSSQVADFSTSQMIYLQNPLFRTSFLEGQQPGMEGQQPPHSFSRDSSIHSNTTLAVAESALLLAGSSGSPLLPLPPALTSHQTATSLARFRPTPLIVSQQHPVSAMQEAGNQNRQDSSQVHSSCCQLLSVACSLMAFLSFHTHAYGQILPQENLLPEQEALQSGQPQRHGPHTSGPGPSSDPSVARPTEVRQQAGSSGPFVVGFPTPLVWQPITLPNPPATNVPVQPHNLHNTRAAGTDYCPHSSLQASQLAPAPLVLRFTYVAFNMLTLCNSCNLPASQPSATLLRFPSLSSPPLCSTFSHPAYAAGLLLMAHTCRAPSCLPSASSLSPTSPTKTTTNSQSPHNRPSSAARSSLQLEHHPSPDGVQWPMLDAFLPSCQSAGLWQEMGDWRRATQLAFACATLAETAAWRCNSFPRTPLALHQPSPVSSPPSQHVQQKQQPQEITTPTKKQQHQRQQQQVSAAKKLQQQPWKQKPAGSRSRSRSTSQTQHEVLEISVEEVVGSSPIQDLARGWYDDGGCLALAQKVLAGQVLDSKKLTVHAACRLLQELVVLPRQMLGLNSPVYCTLLQQVCDKLVLLVPMRISVTALVPKQQTHMPLVFTHSHVCGQLAIQLVQAITTAHASICLGLKRHPSSQTSRDVVLQVCTNPEVTDSLGMLLRWYGSFDALKVETAIAVTVGHFLESEFRADMCDWHLSLMFSRLGESLEKAGLLSPGSLSGAVSSHQADVSAVSCINVPLLGLEELSLTVDIYAMQQALLSSLRPHLAAAVPPLLKRLRETSSLARRPPTPKANTVTQAEYVAIRRLSRSLDPSGNARRASLLCDDVTSPGRPSEQVTLASRSVERLLALDWTLHCRTQVSSHLQRLNKLRDSHKMLACAETSLAEKRTGMQGAGECKPGLPQAPGEAEILSMQGSLMAWTAALVQSDSQHRGADVQACAFTVLSSVTSCPLQSVVGLDSALRERSLYNSKLAQQIQRLRAAAEAAADQETEQEPKKVAGRTSSPRISTRSSASSNRVMAFVSTIDESDVTCDDGVATPEAAVRMCSAEGIVQLRFETECDTLLLIQSMADFPLFETTLSVRTAQPDGEGAVSRPRVSPSSSPQLRRSLPEPENPNRSPIRVPSTSSTSAAAALTDGVKRSYATLLQCAAGEIARWEGGGGTVLGGEPVVELASCFIHPLLDAPPSSHEEATRQLESLMSVQTWEQCLAKLEPPPVQQQQPPQPQIQDTSLSRSSSLLRKLNTVIGKINTVLEISATSGQAQASEPAPHSNGHDVHQISSNIETATRKKAAGVISTQQEVAHCINGVISNDVSPVHGDGFNPAASLLQPYESESLRHGAEKAHTTAAVISKPGAPSQHQYKDDTAVLDSLSMSPIQKQTGSHDFDQRSVSASAALGTQGYSSINSPVTEKERLLLRIDSVPPSISDFLQLWNSSDRGTSSGGPESPGMDNSTSCTTEYEWPCSEDVTPLQPQQQPEQPHQLQPQQQQELPPPPQPVISKSSTFVIPAALVIPAPRPPLYNGDNSISNGSIINGNYQTSVYSQRLSVDVGCAQQSMCDRHHGSPSRNRSIDGLSPLYSRDPSLRRSTSIEDEMFWPAGSPLSVDLPQSPRTKARAAAISSPGSERTYSAMSSHKWQTTSQKAASNNMHVNKVYVAASAHSSDRSSSLPSNPRQQTSANGGFNSNMHTAGGVHDFSSSSSSPHRSTRSVVSGPLIAEFNTADGSYAVVKVNTSDAGSASSSRRPSQTAGIRSNGSGSILAERRHASYNGSSVSGLQAEPGNLAWDADPRLNVRGQSQQQHGLPQQHHGLPQPLRVSISHQRKSSGCSAVSLSPFLSEISPRSPTVGSGSGRFRISPAVSPTFSTSRRHLTDSKGGYLAKYLEAQKTT